MIRLPTALILLLLFVPAIAPARAAGPLSLFTANDLGRADLLPGNRVEVMIELRGAGQATITPHVPPELILLRASASTGTLATTPQLAWAGVVSAAQPVNVVLTYRVAADAQPGDRVIAAAAQLSGQLLRAETVLRICCVAAPPSLDGRTRVYVAVVRR